MPVSKIAATGDLIQVIMKLTIFLKMWNLKFNFLNNEWHQIHTTNRQTWECKSIGKDVV